MGDYYYDKVRARNSASGVGTNAGVTVTQAAPTGNRRLICTGIQVSGDAAALITIESPSGTVLYKKRKAAAFDLSESFAPGTVAGAAGAALLVKISASTSNSEANLQTFETVG